MLRGYWYLHEQRVRKCLSIHFKQAETRENYTDFRKYFHTINSF